MNQDWILNTATEEELRTVARAHGIDPTGKSVGDLKTALIPDTPLDTTWLLNKANQSQLRTVALSEGIDPTGKSFAELKIVLIRSTSAPTPEKVESTPPPPQTQPSAMTNGDAMAKVSGLGEDHFYALLIVGQAYGVEWGQKDFNAFKEEVQRKIASFPKDERAPVTAAAALTASSVARPVREPTAADTPPAPPVMTNAEVKRRVNDLPGGLDGLGALQKVGRSYGMTDTTGEFHSLKARVLVEIDKLNPSRPAPPDAVLALLAAPPSPGPSQARAERMGENMRRVSGGGLLAALAAAALLIGGIVAFLWLFELGRFGDDNTRERLIEAIEENDLNEIDNILEDNDYDDDEVNDVEAALDRLESAVQTADAEASEVRDDLVNALEDLEEDPDSDDIVDAINSVRNELAELADSDEEPSDDSNDDSGDNDSDDNGVDTGSMPKFTSTSQQGSWEINGTERLPENPVVAGWLNRLRDPAPQLWKTFPNIPNPDVPEFRVVNGSEVPDGVEYGTYSSPYCYTKPCDVPVGAWEYRYISGDYEFLGYECKGDGKKGCILLLVNIMDASYTWRNQYVDNGFTVRGRYWNGDALEWGVWGLVSHGSANMLNMPTLAHPGEVLNSGDPGNSGANCGNPAGCGSVDVMVVVHAGDAVVATAHTVVNRP